MSTKNINFKNFRVKKNNNKIKKDLNIILKENNETLKSLSPSYKTDENSMTSDIHWLHRTTHPTNVRPQPHHLPHLLP